MAGFSRTDWYEKNWDTVPGKPAKKGATLKGLLIIYSSCTDLYEKNWDTVGATLKGLLIISTVMMF